MQAEKQTPAIKLYGYGNSPFVRKVGCYLYYKQLPFEHIWVNPITTKEIDFTGGSQVPVLEIDGEWRRESTELGLWLDELFPKKPILPKSDVDQKLVLKTDNWVNESVIPAAFRSIIDEPNKLEANRQAWRLAEIMSSRAEVPVKVKARWLSLLKKTGFVRAAANMTDRTVSVPAMHEALAVEFSQHLADGPFLRGQLVPTIADLSLFPQVAFYFLTGINGDQTYAKAVGMADWLVRMVALLPKNPYLVADFFLCRSLEEFLTISE